MPCANTPSRLAGFPSFFLIFFCPSSRLFARRLAAAVTSRFSPDPVSIILRAETPKEPRRGTLRCTPGGSASKSLSPIPIIQKRDGRHPPIQDADPDGQIRPLGFAMQALEIIPLDTKNDQSFTWNLEPLGRRITKWQRRSHERPARLVANPSMAKMQAGGTWGNKFARRGLFEITCPTAGVHKSD